MKFNKSKDGLKRATVMIPFRVGHSELINLVCYALTHDDAVGLDLQDGSLSVDQLDELTKARIDTMVRQTLRNAGAESYDYWADDVPDDAVDEIVAWVTEEIDRLFPELTR